MAPEVGDENNPNPEASLLGTGTMGEGGKMVAAGCGDVVIVAAVAVGSASHSSATNICMMQIIRIRIQM